MGWADLRWAGLGSCLRRSRRPLLQSGSSGGTSAGAVLLCVYLVFLLDHWTKLKHPSYGDGKHRTRSEETRLRTGTSALLLHSSGQSKSADRTLVLGASCRVPWRIAWIQGT